MDRHEEYLKLYVKHQDHLRAYICSVVRDPGARDDILQEVALILWRKFGEYDPAHSFGAWARGIASNKVLQHRHKSRRLVAFSPEALGAVSTAYAESEERAPEERQALRDCVKTLPPKSRRLLGLRYEQSLKLGEIAERIGSTLDAVNKAVSRIREALRRCVGGKLGGSLGGAA